MLSLSCLAAVTVFASQEDQKPVSAKPKPAPVVTKFYRLTELSGLLQSHPFQGKLPGAAGANVGNLASRPAGNHGSNAPTTGGGMFNVPSPPQGGGLGGGGFGGGGMGFGVNSSRRKYSADSQAVQSAIDLLEQFVEPDSWQDNGGRGVIVPVRQTLMIRTTEDVHKSIRAFLNDLTKYRRRRTTASDRRMVVATEPR